jgi:hypothetical protein
VQGSAHSAIHGVNNGPAYSTKIFCLRVGCLIPACDKVAQRLRLDQRILKKMNIN